jgi:spore maturation protein SpmA
MILNYIWISLILIAVLVGCIQAVCFGNIGIFSEILNSTFVNAKTGFELSLGLVGVLSLWMGIMKIGERAGAVNTLGKAINPFFSRIFPDIPKGHPVFGSMLMNISTNMLGLDNAATPMGLKAMGELQELNKEKDKASNAMIMFVVLGASGLTLIPTTIMGYRATCGAANPADVFLPILIATYVSTLVGLICVCVAQKIRFKDRVVLGTILGLTWLMGLLVWGATLLSHDKLALLSAAAAAVILLGVICWFVIQAMC